MTNTSNEEQQVNRLLNRFANCFDLKQWDEMTACLAPSLYTDYSDLRGTPPETLSNVRFVELRREALQALYTHHMFANHEIDVDGDQAHAKVSAVIFRRNDEGKTLHTHCLYLFDLSRKAGDWKIQSITQKVFWSDGNTSIHAGIIKS